MKSKGFATAVALREIGQILRILGGSAGNPYKARAYLRGAEAVERYLLAGGDLSDLIHEERLTEIPGVGKALASQIAEIEATGASELLTSLRRRIPPGALELLEVRGLTLKKIETLHQALGITSVAELKIACESARVREVKGFGAWTEERILAAIEDRARGVGRRRPLLIHHATSLAEAALARVRASPAIERAEIAGSLRRGVETCERIEIVAASKDPGAALEGFNGLTATVEVVQPAEFGTELFRKTGSKAHVARLEGLGRARNLSIDGPCSEEEEVYGRLGLSWIPPEIREDEGEIEAAIAGTLPRDLIAPEDLRGLVHCHTTYSDGSASLERMVRAAEAMGASFITITDHSPSAVYARGLSLDRLEAQWEEIARLQERVKVRILRGTESDILADGSLDYPDAVLEQMDVVIASVHSRFRMDQAQMTRRVARAMSHPLFKIWGHALGRLIERRPPFEVGMGEVLDVIASSRAAIEINGDPRRLDMEPRYVRAARERGIPFVISTDAHSVGGLQNARYGAMMARRGWVRKGEVLNARPAGEFVRAVRPAG